MYRYDKNTIKIARIKVNKSMDDVAKELNTSRQRYSRFEENPGSFDLDFVIKALNVLDINKDDFFLSWLLQNVIIERMWEKWLDQQNLT